MNVAVKIQVIIRWRRRRYREKHLALGPFEDELKT